jgi:limonene-1,2-epoxide hydrolase
MSQEPTTMSAATTPAQTVRAFLNAYAQRDAEAAMSTVDPQATVDLFPLGLRDQGADALRTLLDDTITAFPDLLVTVTALAEAGDVVAAEVTVEGTQAADYLGAINQEKHLDLDQGWRFTVTGDHITGVQAYWCQNQLYRRLAVKRLDQIAIVGGNQ